MQAFLQAEPPDIGLVIVGDEILSGKRADKHMPKLIELLAARGLQLIWAEYGHPATRLCLGRRGFFVRRHRCDAR